MAIYLKSKNLVKKSVNLDVSDAAEKCRHIITHCRQLKKYVSNTKEQGWLFVCLFVVITTKIVKPYDDFDAQYLQ
jgi:hypothetical protein